MAIKPELKQAVAYNKIKATDYNSNFNTLLDYIEDISEELTLKVNTINSQLSSNVLSSLQSVYPVGSIYIGVTENCPIANLFGTWELVSSGRVLQGADSSHAAGTTIAAGLPDHKHFVHSFTRVQGGYDNGVKWGWSDQTNYGQNLVYTDLASDLNPIYGNSSTVQPPAYVVNIWKRTE